MASYKHLLNEAYRAGNQNAGSKKALDLRNAKEDLTRLRTRLTKAKSSEEKQVIRGLIKKKQERIKKLSTPSKKK